MIAYQKKIFNLVNDNYTTVLRNIEEKDFFDILSISGVKEVYFKIESYLFILESQKNTNFSVVPDDSIVFLN